MPHGHTEMMKTLFSQHTNVHNSCDRNYVFMAEKKNITSVIQHPVTLWLEKIFLHGKKHNKASSIQLFAALTPRTHDQNRQWCKVYKA